MLGLQSDMSSNDRETPGKSHAILDINNNIYIDA